MQGWESFTDTATKAISKHRSGVVFLLWGAAAQSKVGGWSACTRECLHQ